MNSSEETKLVMRFMRVPSALRRQVAELSGHRCSFPGCDEDLMIEGHTFIGEVASIEALNSVGPRYDSKVQRATLLSIENFILLCPNHHRFINQQSAKYPAAWLRDARAKHLGKIQKALVNAESQINVKLDSPIAVSLKDAIAVWDAAHSDTAEEYWQNLFEKCPAVIGQLFPRSMIQIGGKCFVGGKSLSNKGGNIVDFVYANATTNNVVLVEIKSPQTKILGKKYRTNAYSISEELSGSVVQVLSYRDSLIKEYYALSKSEQETPFSVFSPKCVVIAGSIDELNTPSKMRSFELFRNEMSGVEVVTYDELFDKAQGTIDITQ